MCCYYRSLRRRSRNRGRLLSTGSLVGGRLLGRSTSGSVSSFGEARDLNRNQSILWEMRRALWVIEDLPC